MTKYFLSISLLIVSLSLKAQKVTVTKISSDKVYAKAIDVEPEFPGGAKAFYKYISKNIVYDNGAKPEDMHGIVTVSMAIEKDGRISDVTMLKGVSDIVDKEVIRVISSSPRWKPGMQKDTPIKVRYTFRIELTNK